MDDPEGFWAEMATQLRWFTPWTQVLDWKPPFAQWFVGGKLNARLQLPRPAPGRTWRRNKAAIIWEGEPGETRVLTYQELHREVCRFANVLKRLGVKKGDRVGIYMPMIPEAAIAMLACARIGATHSVVFGGFSAEALRDRINDAQAKVVVTADGGYRRGAIVPLKANVDAPLRESPSVEGRRRRPPHRRARSPMNAGRDHWWHELMDAASPRLPGGAARHRASALHPLHQRHDRQAEGRRPHHRRLPAARHATPRKWVFDLKDDDTYWCTADIGWVTGHSYVVYGLLANGATTVMYEGAPN